MNKKLKVDDIFDSISIKAFSNEIMNSRKCTGDDKFSYDVLEKKRDNKTYLLTPIHVSVRDVIDMGNSKCNKCYGTSKKIINILKEKIANPDDFLMLAKRSMEGLNEEQKKILIEEEKQNKFWKILLPCNCAMKKLIKKEDFILSNDMNNIIIKVICEEKFGD